MAARRVLVAQMNDRSSAPVKVEPDVEIAVRYNIHSHPGATSGIPNMLHRDSNII
jgi:hypothetical protein